MRLNHKDRLILIQSLYQVFFLFTNDHPPKGNKREIFEIAITNSIIVKKKGVDFVGDDLSEEQIISDSATYKKIQFLSWVLENLLLIYQDLEDIVSELLRGWHIDRLIEIIKCCLFLGIFEILFLGGDRGGIISDYLQILKKLGCGNDDIGFVNAILDRVLQEKVNLLSKLTDVKLTTLEKDK